MRQQLLALSHRLVVPADRCYQQLSVELRELVWPCLYPPAVLMRRASETETLSMLAVNIRRCDAATGHVTVTSPRTDQLICRGVVAGNRNDWWHAQLCCHVSRRVLSTTVRISHRLSLIVAVVQTISTVPPWSYGIFHESRNVYSEKCDACLETIYLIKTFEAFSFS